MNLNLKNPLVFFDLETTGTNITTDRIIELAYVKVFPNGKTEEKDIYINPGMPIPPASTAVHHITHFPTMTHDSVSAKFSMICF